MLRFRVKILDPDYYKRTSNQSIPITFFGFTLTLRSRSSVDLGEFFNKQGCIGPVDLRFICEYRHGLYFCS